MKYFNIILAGDALSVPEFLLFMVGVGIVGLVIVALVMAGADKSKEVAKNIKGKIERNKQENALNESIKINMREYQDSKNSFLYFSDSRLLNVYKQFQKGIKNSNMEQLALEEELVKRKLIDHSPLHENLYSINKELFK